MPDTNIAPNVAPHAVPNPGLLTGLDEIVDPAHTAVVVIDMQNDFCADQGYIHATQGADMSGNKPLAARIGKLVEAARAAGAMVIWVKAIYDHELLPAPMLSKMLVKGEGRVCCASDSWGADFYEIGPEGDEQVVEKRCYSAFHNTQMDDILRRRGIRSLVMTGVATNVCVESTLREAFFHGYYIVMPPDCVGSANVALHDATIKSVEFIFGEVPGSDEVMAVWAGKAGAAAAAE